MTADWTKLARAEDVNVANGVANVALGERSHRVSIVEEGESFRLVAVVAHPAAVARMSDPALFAWKRNRSSRLVGFRIDRRGRMVGEAWVPKAGVTPTEFQLYLRTVAGESDRLEQLLTGRDVE
ncbi:MULTISPECIES: YbjN domain-containing protein [unclassified Anaeromyxobacter]|uniref:YbjN domain-containing protein n=1 Tax=unclassified Anaeromyxobacter TaxID=2620896 RepID=UPI001F55E6DF|nr:MULTISPECIES: YbjN domain-containing protein [unclassified Anaeromyxobacter]